MGINQGLSITFIIGQLGLGGSEKQLYLLARELKLHGWRVTVINLNPGAGDNWAQFIDQLGIPLFSLYGAGTQIERLVAITKILKKEKPLIVHSWSFYSNFYSALCGFMAGTSVRLGSERGNQEYSKQSYGRWKYSLNLIGLHGLVTNSELEAQLIKREKKGLKIEVIPNGVEDVGLISRTAAREFLGIPDECTLIAGIGSLTPNKNFEYLIEVIAKLTSRFPKLKMILIGDGPEKDRLLQRASELMPSDRFIITGSIANVHKLLKGIDILCISSYSEGMPNVILEACVAGIPVIANKVGSIPSLVKDGVNGFVVKVGDKNEFLGAIEKLIANESLRKEMGASGRNLIRSEFSTRRMVDRFTSFYFEMINS